MKLVISFILFFLLTVLAKTTIAQTNLPECKIDGGIVIEKIPCYGINTEDPNWVKGTIYEGEFNNGMANGYGILTLPDRREHYIGDWKNHKMHGQGEYTWANGSKYIGEWKNGKMNGYGNLSFEEGSLEIDNSTIYRSGEKYIGNWKDNKMHGQGTFIWDNRSKYTGNFKNNKIEGKGKKYFIDGRVYEGFFQNGYYEGLGLLIWPDGLRIEGKWSAVEGNYGVYSATLNFNDGAVYKGQWSHDKFNGNGTMIYSNGMKYKGQWLKGKRFGKGSLTYPNGKKFTGEFTEGFLGNGIYKFGNLIDFWNGILFWTYVLTK